MIRHKNLLVALVATVTLAGAACSKSSSLTPSSPTSGGDSNTTTPPSGVIGQPTATGSGGTLPTGSPGIPTGSFSSGEAKVSVSGGVTASLDLPTMSSGVFSPPPGGMALVWNDNSGEALGLGGQSFTGSAKTTTTLVLTFGVMSSGASSFEQFTSSQGECTITIDTAEAGKVAGSFQCSGVMGSNGTAADASGTFEATA